MSVLVEQQDETIQAIETAAAGVEKDTEAGYVIRLLHVYHHSQLVCSLGYTEKAVVSARAARKKRWICFILTLVILAIVGIVVAVVIVQNNKK